MDMVLDTADTMVMVLVLDMPDTMDILMVDIPTLDKLFPPDIKMDSQPSLFSLSVTTFSVLDIILGDK